MPPPIPVPERSRIPLMEETNFSLQTAAGRAIHGLVQFPAAAGPRPVVVCCHGFKGFMEWGFWPPLADLLAQRGFTVVRFNFSGSGMKPGDERVSDPEAFRANTYRREQEDLAAVLGALDRSEIAAGRADLDRLGLVGHSRGGGAVVLAAANEAWRDRVRALVTWAAISRIDRFDAHSLEQYRQAGEWPVENTRTGQRLAMGPAMLAEVEAPPADLDILAAAARRTAPWLLIHGDQDDAVPHTEAQALAEVAHAPAVFHTIRGGGHTFGAQHPFAGPTPELISLFNLTQAWLLRHLR